MANTMLASRELENSQSVEVTAHYDMEYEDEGVVLFAINVDSEYNEDNGEYDKHVETNVYVHPNGRIEVRERGL